MNENNEPSGSPTRFELPCQADIRLGTEIQARCRAALDAEGDVQLDCEGVERVDAAVLQCLEALAGGLRAGRPAARVWSTPASPSAERWTSSGSPPSRAERAVTFTMPDRAEREFPYEQRHFDSLRALAREEAGIELADHKRELVYGRVCRRLRELRLDSFDAYVALVTPKGSPERRNFVNCITTNVTAFFREGHHFTFLRDEAVPQLMKTRQATRRLRIWSAACSTGQEPYSIAITMARAMEGLAYPWDWKVLATDIDSNVVARAQAGVYGVERDPGLRGGRDAALVPAGRR